MAQFLDLEERANLTTEPYGKIKVSTDQWASVGCATRETHIDENLLLAGVVVALSFLPIFLSTTPFGSLLVG